MMTAMIWYTQGSFSTALHYIQVQEH
jgi:hypothetical protein